MAEEFSKKNIHQKLEQLSEPRPATLSLKLVRNPYLGRNNLPCGKKNFWSDVGEDPGSDPAVATEIDRTLSLLDSTFPEKIDDST